MGLSLNRRKTLGLLGGAAILPTISRAQTGIKAGSPRLRRGMNVHNVLNWPDVIASDGRVDYVWPPFQGPGYALSGQELSALKSYGFDFIRLTADPSILLEADSARWAYLRAHLLAVLRQLNDAGFNVIFDLHPVAVNPADGPAPLVASPTSPLFESYTRMVGRVAEALNETPPGSVVFELMNEPWLTNADQLPRWQAMLEKLHASARAVAPALPLLLTGAYWGDWTALLKLNLTPFKSSNVFYTFHYYDPHLFTHQGVDNEDTRFISGLSWPATAESANDVLARASILIATRGDLGAAEKDKALSSLRRRLDALVAKKFDKKQIRSDFLQVAQWAQANGVTPDRIVLGEFGCELASNGVTLGKDRLDWLATVRTAAEEMGFAWAYWQYKGYGGMEFVDAGGRLHQDLLEPLGLRA